MVKYHNIVKKLSIIKIRYTAPDYTIRNQVFQRRFNYNIFSSKRILYSNIIMSRFFSNDWPVNTDPVPPTHIIFCFLFF